MADGIARLLRDRELAHRIASAGLQDVQQFGWSAVKDQWIDIYARLMPSGAREGAVVSRCRVGDGASSRPVHDAGSRTFCFRCTSGSRVTTRAPGLRGLEATQWLDRAAARSAAAREPAPVPASTSATHVPYYQRAVREPAGFVPDERAVARRSRAGAVPHQGADPRQRRSPQGARCGQAHPLQHGRIERRAAGVLHRSGPRQPRRGGEMARDALVGRRHRRPRDRRVGLADRAQRAGPRAAVARPPAAHRIAAGVRHVRGEPRSLHRTDQGKAPEDAVRLSVGARAHRPPRRAPQRAPRRPRDQGRVRHVGTPVRPSAPADRAERSAAASPTATAAATPASSRTSAPKARSTSRPRTSSSNWSIPRAAWFRRANRERSS